MNEISELSRKTIIARLHQKHIGFDLACSTAFLSRLLARYADRQFEPISVLEYDYLNDDPIGSEIKCLNCGKSFFKRTGLHSFCSTKCNMSYRTKEGYSRLAKVRITDYDQYDPEIVIVENV